MRRLAFAALVPVFMVSGCATTSAPVVQPGKVVYPPAPAAPVIEWVASYHRQSDVDPGRQKWKKVLVGEEEREIGLEAPTAVAFGSGGTLYVVDQQTNSIAIIDPIGKSFDTFSGQGSGRLTNPAGVAVADDGALYVSDSASRTVYRFDSNLRFDGIIGGPQTFLRPTGLALSSDDSRLAVCDSHGHAVYIFDTTTGETVLVLGSDQSGSSPGEFRVPYEVAFDNDGYIYVTDYLNFRVQVFDPEGDVELAFGEPGDRIGQMNRPRGIAADAANGVIYQVDGAFQNVQMFNFDGEMLMWFGETGQGPGQFSLPTDVAIQGDLIAVTDTLNQRVQIFRFLGTPSKR